MVNANGYIDVSNLHVPPEKDELSTARFFAEMGKTVVFIRPSSIPNQHTPDILMDGVEWEIKCPRGNSRRTIENNMRKALLQSNNIIFDLRHIKMYEERCISQLKDEFNKRSQLKKLYIIKKNGELLLFK